MLISALLLATCWLVLASIVLLGVGRHLGGPSPLGSLLLVLLIEGCGGAAATALFRVPGTVAVGSAIISTLLAILVIRAFPHWNAAGHAAWLFSLEAGVAYLLVAAAFTLLVPVSIAGQILGLVLLAMQGVSLVLALSYSHELLDVVCRRRWRRPEGRPPRMVKTNARSRHARQARGDGEPPALPPGWTPRIALHVPCHDEPPEVVERTLYALAELEYPRDAFEVFVVDNNTKDATLWQPLAAVCDQLGFTFLHLEDWPGFKSGALNYALAVTPVDFDIIGVVDADYLVKPEYLHELAGYFADPGVAFVQTPQDYRDYRPDSTFYQRACYHAYRYFFDLSMPSRNERNAIIFGGTMGLIRADVLRTIGGWDEWCITEDAEASLRLLARGYTGLFVNQSYGRGLMPLEFDALKRQRFRWCFGGIQILRKHWASLLPWVRRARPADGWEMPGLTGVQRYHYLVGGLQWYGDVLSFGFTMLLLITGWLSVLGRPLRLPVLGGPLLLLPLIFWAFSLLRTLWGLRATRRCTWGEALGAVGILWSLSWVVTLACLQGLIRSRGVFLRTPKAARAGLVRALRSTTIETTLGAACWGLGALLLTTSASQMTRGSSPGAVLAGAFSAAYTTPWWLLGTSGVVLGFLAFMQGTTYMSAPVMCLLSLRSEKTAREVRRRALGTDAGEGTLERRLLLSAFAGAAVLAILLVAAASMPQPSVDVSATQQGALKTLLGNGNPAATPSATPNNTQTSGTATAQAGNGSPTATTPGSPTSSPTPIATTHPGGTPTTRPTGSPTVHPGGATPTPRR